MFDGTALLFGLPGVRVERVERLPGRHPGGARGDRADQTAAACPSCGVFSTSVKGRLTTSPKDIPYGEERIIVRWNKTRWRCREDYCERSSFTETIAQVPARARTTQRLRTQIGTMRGTADLLFSPLALATVRSRVSGGDLHGFQDPNAAPRVPARSARPVLDRVPGPRARAIGGGAGGGGPGRLRVAGRDPADAG